MKILALEKEIPGIIDSQFTPEILRNEAKRAWELYQKGVIREIYFRSDQESAILILECKNIDEAKSILATLPLVKDGLVAFDILPLKAYPGFERLFEKKN